MGLLDRPVVRDGFGGAHPANRVQAELFASFEKPQAKSA